MIKDDFVKHLIAEAFDHGRAETFLKAQANPVGRGVKQEQRDRADWINALSDDDRARVLQLINDAMHATVFSTLVMLDDGIIYEDGEEAGEIRLEFQAPDGTVTHINAPRGEDMHDIFNWIVRDGPEART